MTKDKVAEIIKKRIKETKEEYAQQKERCGERWYDMYDIGWYEGKIRAYNEALGVIGMLDKENNK